MANSSGAHGRRTGCNHLGSLEDQCNAAKAYYKLFSKDGSDLQNLNGDGPPVACIIVLPESYEVQIIYALGFPQNVLKHTAATTLYGLMGDLQHSAMVPDMI